MAPEPPRTTHPIPMQEAQRDWFETAFEAEYLELYAHRDLAAARQEVAWLIDQGVSGVTLDLCCGFGRHSYAMAEQGLSVFGLDLSQDLLARLHHLPQPDRLTGRLVRADARRVPVADGVFDALVNLFSSFGYFGLEGDRAVLDEIERVLKPGGRLVMDLMNPARVRNHLQPTSRTERGGYVLYEERRLEEGGQRVTKAVRMVAADGSEKRWKEDVRLYELEDMRPALERRGIEIERVFGDFGELPFAEDSPRQILVARKRGSAHPAC